MSSTDQALGALAGGLLLGRLEGGMHVPMLRGDSQRWLRRRTPLFHAVLVEAGRLDMRLGDAAPDGCEAGSALLIQPGLVHDLSRREAGGVITWADFTITCWGAIPITELMDFPPRLPAEAARAISGHLAVLLDPPPGQGIAQRLAGMCRHRGGLLAEVLALGRWQADAADRVDALLRLAPLLAGLADHLGEPWPRERLARVAGVSMTRLNQIFLAATGRSPAGFVRDLRLNRAAELLLTTAMPLAAIADHLGFVDAFHLSRCFKVGHGVAPALYRRQYRRPVAGEAPPA